MNRTLSWVLGILAVLVLIAVLAGGAWMWMNRGQMMGSYAPYAVQPNAPGAPNGQNLPNGPRGFENDGRNPMGGWGFRGPMMGGRGHFSRFGPFGMGMFFLGGLLRLIFPLGLLALVAFLFYRLGRRSAIVTTPHTEPARTNGSAPGPDSPKTE